MATDEETPRARLRLRRPTWRGWFTIGVIVALLVVVVLWAIDYGTLGNRVARNVTVENAHLGRKSGPALHKALAQANAEYGTGSVVFIVNGRAHPMSAATIGLHLDEAATLSEARRVARSDPPPFRPFTWFASLFHARRAPVRITLDHHKLAAALATLPSQTPVVEPRIVGSVDSIGMSAGHSGIAFDPTKVARRIESAARTGTLPLRVSLTAGTVDPSMTDADMAKLTDKARNLTNRNITLNIPGQSMVATPAQLRSWITSVVPAGSGHAELAMQSAVVREAVKAQIDEVVVHPQSATFTVEGSKVLLVPQVEGQRCCSLSSGKTILKALEAAKPAVDVPLEVFDPKFTTAEARKLGVTTLLGAGLTTQAQRVWKPEPGPAPPDSATPDASTTTTTTTTTTVADGGDGPGQAIVPIPNRSGQAANVGTAIPLLRGRIIMPGKQLSLNAVVGAPSPDNGFVPADVLTADGPTWVSGGGTDLVAAALFQAAYGAGLDIPNATAPSVLRPGVPSGIDATLGWTQPDLVISNPSKHAVLVWVDRVRGDVRVQLFGTPFTNRVSTARKQTPYGPDNACLAVTVRRTRNFSDGRQASDSFNARYTPAPHGRDDPDRIICPT